MNYHMKGSDMGDLVVLAMNGKMDKHWHIKGNQGTSWKKVQINLNPNKNLKVKYGHGSTRVY